MSSLTLADAGSVPCSIEDPINAQILKISEDRLSGFQADPFGAVAERTGLPPELIIERIQSMLRAGAIRRVRQTLLATSLAKGALIAWQIPEDRLSAAFDYLFQCDPFSGHVVIRTADPSSPGARYRLWTTLKTPQGFCLEKHCALLGRIIGAEHFKIMPAKKLFALGVGHLRRRELSIGSRADTPADVQDTDCQEMTEREWRALTAIKREFAPEELTRNLWSARAKEAGMSEAAFIGIAQSLTRRGVIGRFSTFLEHVKPDSEGTRATRYNALFHWAVPNGQEIPAGREVGRFHIMTHAYWREGGPEFQNVNIMGVAHGLDKDLLLAHKDAIDAHLKTCGIPVGYTNVFWGGRSEIKPSEISPDAYLDFCRSHAIDPEQMRASTGA